MVQKANKKPADLDDELGPDNEAAKAKAKAEKEAKEAEKAAEAKAKAKSVPVLLLRDYWDEDGTRHKKGASVKLTVTEAKALIAGKKAERNDPLPGEED